MLTNLEMNQNIADFIGKYCTKWNISILKFAEKCAIPYMTMKRIMDCNVQKIDVYTISRIAQTTKTPIMEILGIDDEDLGLYKRISMASDHDKQIITYVLTILEKLHVSGKECREIPFADLDYDRKSFLLEPSLFSSDYLNFNQMNHITLRSTFSEGYTYFGFRLPNNHLSPLYYKGDVLLVANKEPIHGDIGAFAFKNEGRYRIIFRKLNDKGPLRELLPITGRGKKYVINTESILDLMNWVILGVVVGMVR